MAEEVEISNVGGEGGVASEATLASLTRAIEKLAGATGRDPKKEAAKVQKMHTKTLQEDIKAIEDSIDQEKKKTKAVEKAIDATNRYSRAVIGAVGGLLGSLSASVLGLSKALFDGGDQLSDFAQHIPLIGSLITPFTEMLDNSISTFRDLSSVGAGFNNSITDMRMTAASLELNLDEMSGLVRNNSENLRFLGGTVTEGVKRFTAINKSIKATGDFAFFKNLGFTIEEINEGMLSYIGLQAGLGRLQRMDNMAIQQGTAAYLEDLDELAKLTGKQRDDIAASMQQEMNDARVRAMVARMTDEQQQRFNANLALISNTIPGMANSFKNLAAGVPTDEVSQALLSIGGSAGRAMAELFANAEDIDTNEFQRRITELAPQLAQHLNESFSTEQVAAIMSGAGGEVIASLLELGGDLQKAGNIDVDAMLAEQASREDITETLTTFDDAIKAMRATIASAILDSGLFEDLAGAVASVADLIKSEDFKNAFKDFIGTIKSFIDNFRNFGLSTALFGGTGTTDTPAGPQTVQIEGLIEDLFGQGGLISGAFASVAPQIGTMFTNLLGSAFSGLSGGIVNWFDENWGKILLGALAGVGVLLAAPFVGIGAMIVAPVIAAFAGIATYFGAAQIEEWISDAWNAVTGVFSGIGNWWSGISFTDMFNNTWDAVTGIFSGISNWWSSLGFGDMISNTWDSITGVFSGIGDWWSGISFTDMFNNTWNSISGVFSSISDWWSTLDFNLIISNAWNSITGVFSGIGDWWNSISFTDMFNNTWNSITGVFSGISDWWSSVNFSTIFDNLWNKITSVFDFELPDVGSFLPDWMRSNETVEQRELNANVANEFAGYGGMATGGIASGPDSGYMMQLHGTEAVVPLPNGRSIPVDFSTTTASTEIPKIEIDNIAILTENIQDMKNEIVKNLNTTNQSTQDTIKQLNRLMSQLLEVMQEMAEDADNIERNTRSMGGNIASGRISAVR